MTLKSLSWEQFLTFVLPIMISEWGGSDDLYLLNIRLPDLLELNFLHKHLHHNENFKTTLVRIFAAPLKF